MLTKIVFICILEVFFGSKTYYLMCDTHFFFSENILQSIYHIPWRKIWTFQVEKWGIDPKTCCQESHSFSDVFLGSNAHFLTSYNHFLSSGSLFLINFMKFLRKRDILGENIAICLQTGGFWNYKIKKKPHL